MNESVTPRSYWTKTNVLSLAALMVFILWLAVWFYGRAGYVHVSDARVSATMISISSRIPGWLREFPVEAGMRVKPGDVLVRMDDRDVQFQLQRLTASLENVATEMQRFSVEYDLLAQQIASKVEADVHRLRAARSALAETEVQLTRAKREARRSTSLLADKMISEEIHDNRQALVEELEQTHIQRVADVEVAEAELMMARASRAELDIMQSSQQLIAGRKRELEIERDRLLQTLNDHTIVSAIHGIVDETFANTGEYVYPGQRILMIHDPDRLWIKANVKETEIRHLRIGQPVNITVDAYPDQPLVGHIQTIGSAATSQFALLPSPNPSGNFTKVTQRLEVQIELDQRHEDLRPGMMVELAIDIQSDCCNDAIAVTEPWG